MPIATDLLGVLDYNRELLRGVVLCERIEIHPDELTCAGIPVCSNEVASSKLVRRERD